jgi:molybdopterin converting factor small subunit
MPVTLHVPMSLREFSGGRARIDVELAEAATLGDVFEQLRASHAGITERVLTEQGAVRQHVNLFVDGENARLGAGLATPVKPGAEIWILPAVSGG